MIEILIAIAILAIIIGLGLFVGFDFYKSYSFHSEKSVIVSSLQKARNQSLSNINQTRHGVHFEAAPSLKYIIFECPINNPKCTDYTASSTDIIISSSYGISIISPSSLPFDVVFDQLSGSCVSPNCLTNPLDITISDGIKSYNVFVNSEGRIDW